MNPSEVADLRRWLDESKGLADGRPFLGDRRLDAMMDVMLELSAQVWMVKRRNVALEAILTESGGLAPAAIETFTFSPEETAAMREDRAAFVATLFRSMASLSTEAETEG